jgi:hypothetical protein
MYYRALSKILTNFRFPMRATISLRNKNTALSGAP